MIKQYGQTIHFIKKVQRDEEMKTLCCLVLHLYNVLHCGTGFGFLGLGCFGFFFASEGTVSCRINWWQAKEILRHLQTQASTVSTGMLVCMALKETAKVCTFRAIDQMIHSRLANSSKRQNSKDVFAVMDGAWVVWVMPYKILPLFSHFFIYLYSILQYESIRGSYRGQTFNVILPQQFRFSFCLFWHVFSEIFLDLVL